MNEWPKDNTAALKAFYGNPAGVGASASPKWMKENLIRVPVPWRMVLSWDDDVQCSSIQFHRKAAVPLAKILTQLWDRAGRQQSAIDAAGLNLYGGSFNYRLKRGVASLSVHAFGAALDFDPARNGLGNATPYMPDWVVKEFKREGAVWGGKFRRPDGMHFQFASI